MNEQPINDLSKTKEIVNQIQHNIAKAMIAKVGRNEKCPCGSNKKFKKCCGKEV
jgi:uncharacterized protein YecA (UPF0149 family)